MFPPDLNADPQFAPNRWAARLTPRFLLLLWLAGLGVRLATAFLYGTQDMEYWKGWGDYLVHHRLSDIYGATDQEIVTLWTAGRTIPEITAATQRPIPFRDVRYYSVRGYPICQPPLLLYSLYPGAWLYRLFDPGMPNGYWFNFFTNLQPIFFSWITALIIGRITRMQYGVPIGRVAALAFWLNPLVILNTPVQGYQDILCSMLSMLAVIGAFQKRPIATWGFLAMALLVKPWAFFVAPAVIWVALREQGRKGNLIGILAAAAVSVLICLPFLVTSHFLSMILGVISLSVHARKLSLQALNLWWPVQYAANLAVLMRDYGLSVWSAQSQAAVFEDVPTAGFSQRFGVPASGIATALWLGFSILNFMWMRAKTNLDRRVVILGCALQAYGWYLFRTGLQGHQSFILVPVLSLVMFASPELWRRYIVIIAILFSQELLFYGFGRDFNPGRDMLFGLGLSGLTVILAIAHVVFFVRFLSELDFFAPFRRPLRPEA